MENILLDGSFIVEKKMDDFFEFAKLANLFVCNATLGEVQKSDFYAKLTSAKVEDVELLPNGKSLKNGDKCKKYTLENSLVIYEIVRDEYIHVLTVEGKVLQIAKDYHLAIDTSYDQKRLKAKVITTILFAFMGVLIALATDHFVMIWAVIGVGVVALVWLYFYKTSNSVRARVEQIDEVEEHVEQKGL